MLRALALLGSLFFVVPLHAVAEGSLTAETVSVTTPVYKPSFEQFEPRLGTYTYEVSWQGIPAAEAKVEVSQDGDVYSIRTSARTLSAIDIFYTLRYSAEGIISAVDLAPIRTVIRNQENSRVKNVEMSFEHNGEIVALRTGNNKEPNIVRFNPNNNTLDPFSAAFLARSLDWKVGDTKEFDTFNGKSRYLIRLTATGKEMVEDGGQQKEAWVVVPQVINLTNREQTKKLREAKIYVTTDRARDVLEIRSKVFIGTVSTKLVGFEPSQRPADLATRVALQRKREFVQ